MYTDLWWGPSSNTREWFSTQHYQKICLNPLNGCNGWHWNQSLAYPNHTPNVLSCPGCNRCRSGGRNCFWILPRKQRSRRFTDQSGSLKKRSRHITWEEKRLTHKNSRWENVYRRRRFMQWELPLITPLDPPFFELWSDVCSDWFFLGKFLVGAVPAARGGINYIDLLYNHWVILELIRMLTTVTLPLGGAVTTLNWRKRRIFFFTYQHSYLS